MCSCTWSKNRPAARRPGTSRDSRTKAPGTIRPKSGRTRRPACPTTPVLLIDDPTVSYVKTGALEITVVSVPVVEIALARTAFAPVPERCTPQSQGRDPQPGPTACLTHCLVPPESVALAQCFPRRRVLRGPLSGSPAFARNPSTRSIQPCRPLASLKTASRAASGPISPRHSITFPVRRSLEASKPGVESRCQTAGSRSRPPCPNVSTRSTAEGMSQTSRLARSSRNARQHRQCRTPCKPELEQIRSGFLRTQQRGCASRNHRQTPPWPRKWRARRMLASVLSSLAFARNPPDQGDLVRVVRACHPSGRCRGTRRGARRCRSSCQESQG